MFRDSSSATKDLRVGISGSPPAPSLRCLDHCAEDLERIFLTHDQIAKMARAHIREKGAPRVQ